MALEFLLEFVQIGLLLINYVFEVEVLLNLLISDVYLLPYFLLGLLRHLVQELILFHHLLIQLVDLQLGFLKLLILLSTHHLKLLHLCLQLLALDLHLICLLLMLFHLIEALLQSIFQVLGVFRILFFLGL